MVTILEEDEPERLGEQKERMTEKEKGKSRDESIMERERADEAGGDTEELGRNEWRMTPEEDGKIKKGEEGEGVGDNGKKEEGGENGGKEGGEGESRGEGGFENLWMRMMKNTTKIGSMGKRRGRVRKR